MEEISRINLAGVVDFSIIAGNSVDYWSVSILSVDFGLN
jgi:hypothetical protein